MSEPGAADPAVRLLQLAQGMARLDPLAGWEELRDVLWLANHLPAATAPPDAAQALSAEPSPKATDTAGAPAAAPPAVPPSRPSTAAGATRPVAVDDTRADDDPDADSAVYGGAAGAAGGGAGGLRAIHLPSPPPLPEAAALARALRPLGRRRARGAPRLLDEEASAEALAHTGLPTPVLRPLRQRWFDAVVVVDTHLPLLAWRPRVDEFVALLRRRAGLRDVHLFSLHPQPHGLVLRAPDGRSANPAAWQHGQGGRLLLLVSDASGAAWHDGRIARWLQPWAACMPVAVAQLLPEPLWPHTGLGFADLRVQAQRRGQPSATLAVQRPDWAEGEPGLVLPVLALEPVGARRWARMLMAAGGATCPAALLPFDGGGATPATPRVPESAMLLAALRRSARPRALKLAAALAAIKPLTLPVLRLVQASLPGGAAGHEDLAQVLASGLLSLRGPAPADTPLNQRIDDLVTLDMADPVRDELVGGLLRSEWWQLNLAVQRYVEQASGNPFDFMAYLEDRQGSSQLAPAALPFARFARRLAERFRPPGAAGAVAGRRMVHEAVAGPGLTVRAEVMLAAPVRQLRWSTDGQRLGVLHGLGLDVFEAPRLHHGPRTRRGGWVLHVLCHAADTDPVRELLTGVARQLELRTGRAVGVRVEGMVSIVPANWMLRVAEEMSFRSTAVERAGDQPVMVIALTASLAQPGSREHRVWRQEMLRQKLVPLLALAEPWAGLYPMSDLWLDALAWGAASPELQPALDALQKALPALADTSLRGEVEAFAFADEAGRDWMAVHRAGHLRALALHQPRTDGEVEAVNAAQLALGPGEAVEMPAVKALEFSGGVLHVLHEGNLGTTWRAGGVGAEASPEPMRGLAVAGPSVYVLRPDLGIEVSSLKPRPMFDTNRS